MADKRISSVDLDTGEILEYSLVAIQRKIPNGFREGWIAMAQGALMTLATSIKHLDDYRVLMALLALLDFENLTNVSQVELAEKLGMHKQHVNRSIKRLIELGCLLEGPTVRRSRTYRLNPNYGWKGSGKEHQKALRAHEKAAAAGLKVHKGGRVSPDHDASE